MDRRIRDPVVHYLGEPITLVGDIRPSLDPDRQSSHEAAAVAHYPKSVRDLITSNSQIVHDDITRSRTWIGENVDFGTNINYTPAFAHIKVGLSNRVKTEQGGGSGPFSIEAAFILGTQLAGINFRNVAKRIRDSGRYDEWWIGVLMPGDKSDGVRELHDENTAQEEPWLSQAPWKYGKCLRSDGNSQHDQNAGIYIAFVFKDLDPTPETDSSDICDDCQNVFVFIVHAIDAFSVIKVDEDSSLRNVDIVHRDPPNPVRLFFQKGPQKDPQMGVQEVLLEVDKLL
ncbi:hypothetical protein RhiJN_24556 [Ceratobasidium sp. AG-Ba]|nr:hypothetical protein RhiJN_24556 [Ceratobasidium sp. AG-Ba]